MVRVLTLHCVGGGRGHSGGRPIIRHGQVIQLRPKLTGESLLRHAQVGALLLAERDQDPIEVDCCIRVAVREVPHDIPKG